MNEAGEMTAMKSIIQIKPTVTDTWLLHKWLGKPNKMNILNDDSFLRLLQCNEVSYFYSYSYPNYIEEAE